MSVCHESIHWNHVTHPDTKRQQLQYTFYGEQNREGRVQVLQHIFVQDTRPVILKTNITQMLIILFRHTNNPSKNT